MHSSTSKIHSAILVLLSLLVCALPAHAQLYPVTSTPSGRAPAGMALLTLSPSIGAGTPTVRLVVANSGDDSVRIYDTSTRTLSAAAANATTITGIRAPFAIVPWCGPDVEFIPGRTAPLQFAVTSPTDNSITLVRPGGNRRVAVGSQPYAATCAVVDGRAVFVVSNFGDQSISIVDSESGTVLSQRANVPGSRGAHGVAVCSAFHVCVAGSNANTITVINPEANTIIGRISVQQPINLTANTVYGFGGIFTYRVDTLTTTFVRQGTGMQYSVATPTGGALPASKDLALLAPPGTSASVAVLADPSPETLTSIIDPQDLTAQAAYSCDAAGCRASDAVVYVSSRSTNSIYTVGVTPRYPAQITITDAAAFLPGVSAPGALVSLFGSTGLTGNFAATSVPLPRTLGGLTVKVGGQLTLTTNGVSYSSFGAEDAALLFAGPQQINFQIPPSAAAGGVVAVLLQRADASTLLGTVDLRTAAPQVFVVGGSRGAVLNQDGTLNSPANPARRGSVIQIYATGGGATAPQLGTGEPAPTDGRLALTTTPARVRFTAATGDPIVVDPQFSGIAPGFVGLWQINATVPETLAPGSAVSLEVIQSTSTSKAVTIAVQ